MASFRIPRDFSYPLAAMLLGLLVLAVSLAGLALDARLWHGDADRAGRLERVSSAALLGLATWTAANWILSSARLLNRGGLAAAAVLLGAGSVALLVRRRWRLPPGAESGSGVRVPFAALALAPMGGWFVFATWKGWILPPNNADALVYHMTKALLIARAGGMQFFDAPDARISCFPANYELLLADMMILNGSDRGTALLSLLGWVLFALASAALAERYWGGGLPPLVAALVAAGTPLTLIHSSAHKHDLLTAFYGVGAFLWGSRWCARPRRRPAVLAITALALAAGTKVTSACIILPVVAISALFAVRAWWRGERPGGRALPLLLGGFVACVLLLGGLAYVLNFIHTGSVLGPNVTGAPANLTTLRVDRDAFWMFPILLATVPFSPNPVGVWVPWEQTYWYWPHYDVFLSHYGIMPSLLLPTLPFLLYKFRRSAPGMAGVDERLICGAMMLVGFFVPTLTPVPLKANFIVVARYVVWVVPGLVALTAAPLVWSLGSAGPKEKRVAMALVLAAGGLLLYNGFFVARLDFYAPWAYVKWASEHPGTRATAVGRDHAAVVLDRIAGPHDVVAFDAADGTWTYPAYGAGLSREIVYLEPGGTDPVAIPDRARFVLVDRASNIDWGHPKLTHEGFLPDYFSRGTPTADELRVFRQLSGDPRFRLVFHYPPRNQAIFERLGQRPDAPAAGTS